MYANDEVNPENIDGYPVKKLSGNVYVVRSAVDAPITNESPLNTYEKYIQTGAGLTDVKIAGCDFFDDEYDVILPTPLYVHPSLQGNYCGRHTASSWNAMLEAMKEIHPECAAEAEEFFAQTACYCPCNMLIAKKNVYDALCNWLFPILFTTMEKCGIIEDTYQNRYPGFLSERLITFFFCHKRDEYKVVYADKVFLN